MMNSIVHSVVFVLVFALAALLVSAQTQDSTLIERSRGRDVAVATLRKIKDSQIFREDFDFFRRLAYVESNFGLNTKTYRDDYFGGIWQVDQGYYNPTKAAYLSQLHQNITDKFQINWANTTWNDLLKPLYSGIGARLYFESKNITSIPQTLAQQGQFWTNHYRPSYSSEYFVQKVLLELEATPECEGKMDICIIMDGSGSVGQADFLKAKDFVADLVNTFSLETTRVSFIEYSTAVREIFRFNNTYNATEMERVIKSTPYLGGNTNTPDAILKAIDFYDVNVTTVRPGVPRIVATFTDGVHNLGNLAYALVQLMNSELTSFAVGIGSGINQQELEDIALKDTSKVFALTDFSALAEFFYKLNAETCEIAQEPEIGANETDSLREDERRYYRFRLPVQGVTIRLDVSLGSVAGYFSYTVRNPNSAYHDGVIMAGGSFISFSTGTAASDKQRRQMRQAASEESVYVTAQGLDFSNTYVLASAEGNQVREEPATCGASGIYATAYGFGVAVVAIALRHVL